MWSKGKYFFTENLFFFVTHFLRYNVANISVFRFFKYGIERDAFELEMGTKVPRPCDTRLGAEISVSMRY